VKRADGRAILAGIDSGPLFRAINKAKRVWGNGFRTTHHRGAPAERVAFVLHDVFDVAFDDIAAIVGRSPAAARQLASRARRRVRGTSRASGAALPERRETVEAFLRGLRAADIVPLTEARELHGASRVAEEVLKYRDIARVARPIQVNGTVEGHRITKMEVIADPERLRRLNLAVFPG
jgi:hypothetical protein